MKGNDVCNIMLQSRWVVAAAAAMCLLLASPSHGQDDGDVVGEFMRPVRDGFDDGTVENRILCRDVYVV